MASRDAPDSSYRSVPERVPPRRVDSRRRRRSPVPRLAFAAFTIAGLAVVALLVGFSSPLDTSLFVLVDGRPALVAPGTRLSDVARAGGLAPRAGAMVDVAGDVLSIRGGEPGALEVRGAPESGDPVLTGGDTIVARTGADVSERLVRRTEALPFDTRTEGSGPVIALVRGGAEGERELFSGVKSKRTVASFTLASPVDALFRRTRGLSPGQKAVALTFDDGPGPYTPQVLDVLETKGVSATFFVIGRTAAGNAGTIQALKAAGHEVENHSWSHADLTALSPEAVSKEISRASQAIGGARFLRPPYGSHNPSVDTQAGAAGLRIALWDVDTRDWQSRDAAAIKAKVVAGARPGAIILMHDGGGDRSQTVAALPGIIDWLLKNGYALTTLAKLTG